MKIHLSFLLACVALFNCVASADSLVLHNGTKLTGLVTENTDYTVSIQTENGRTLTYPAGDVLKIEYSDQKAISATTSTRNRNIWNHPGTYTRYSNNNTGFWFSAEALGGSSIETARKNAQFAEIDLYAGYRFNEIMRVGFGLGPRYYFNNGNLRYSRSEWGMPIMLNVRGNIIPTVHRSIVPYYSLDLGGTVGDGFMIRPHLGVRIGEPRSAFLLSVTYMGQKTDCLGKIDPGIKESDFISFLGINLGYEF